MNQNSPSSSKQFIDFSTFSSFFYPTIYICFAHTQEFSNTSSAYSGIVYFYCKFFRFFRIFMLSRFNCITKIAVFAFAALGSGRIKANTYLMLNFATFWASSLFINYRCPHRFFSISYVFFYCAIKSSVRPLPAENPAKARGRGGEPPRQKQK